MVGRFHNQYQSMLDQQRQVAVAQATAQAGLGPRLAEISATGAEARRTAEAEARARLAANPDTRLVVPPTPKTSAGGADKVTSPLKITLDSAKAAPLPSETRLIP